jgi:hypothetical protein
LDGLGGAWGGGQNFAQVERPFPIPFWRVSVAALSSRDPGEGRVSCWWLSGALG